MLENQLERIATALEMIAKRLGVTEPIVIDKEDIPMENIADVETQTREDIKKELIKLKIPFNSRANTEYLSSLLKSHLEKPKIDQEESEKKQERSEIEEISLDDFRILLHKYIMEFPSIEEGEQEAIKLLAEFKVKKVSELTDEQKNVLAYKIKKLFDE